MKIVFCTLHVRRSPQAVSLAAGCLTAAFSPDLRKSTVLLDAYNDQTDPQILSAILEKTPDIVAFPVYLWNRQRVVRLCQELHRQSPGLRLVAGGPEATGDPSGLLAAAPWTALVHGEGETALVGLIKALEKGHADQPLAGVTLIGDDGSQITGERYCPHDLAKATSPWLSGVLSVETGAGVLWEVARGCAFSCDYCFDARGHAGVRAIDQKRLGDELKLFSRAGISQVWVLDSTFNYPPERGVALLELLLKKAPHLHYHLEAKADFIDRHTVNLLGQLDCSIQIGLQSVHEQVLKSIHRPLDLNILNEKIHLLEAEGIIYGFDLIYGLPGDNYAGFRESINTTLGFSPNHVHIFPLSILPGTRLAQHQKDYGIEAQQEPPYELLASEDWTREEMELCRRLATAVDLFYNMGRAVAFFPAILQALQNSPSELFEDFYRWALQQPEIDHDRLADSDNWRAGDVYRLLQGYICHKLQNSGQGHLVSVFLDLLCYHFHFAETLLGEELLPPSDAEALMQKSWWETPLVRSRKYRLVPFAYEILDLLEMEEMQLEEMASLFRPVGSVALFMRRDNEVFCESLGEEMLRLLQKSDGSCSPKEIFAGSVPQATGEELVAFAVSEGLLLPA